MSKRPTLLQHFRSFAYQNNTTNFDVALEYFTVFGGTGWDVETSGNGLGVEFEDAVDYLELKSLLKYDKKIEITILAKRESGKILVGECKYSKREAKMHMLSSLKEKCEKVGLNADEYVLFSKNGFTSEMKELSDENLMLLTNEDFFSLLDNLNEKDLLVYKNKKY